MSERRSGCAPVRPAALVAVDLDGTVCGSDGEAHSDTVQALARLRVPVALVTGRAPADARRWLPICSATWAVSMGGVVVEGPGLRVVDRTLPDSLLDALAELEPETGVEAHIHGVNQWVPLASADATYRYARRHGLTPSSLSMIREAAVGVELMGPDGAINGLLSSLAESLTTLTVRRNKDAWGQLVVDITTGADKDKGLAIVLDRLGIDWADVLAIGDGYNDAALFQRAGTAVAVAGAPDALLAVATHRINRGPDEAAVAAVLTWNEHLDRGEVQCLHRDCHTWRTDHGAERRSGKAGR